MNFIIGAGGHGYSVLGLCRRLRLSVEGFIDSNSAKQGTKSNGLTILGDEQWLFENYQPHQCSLIMGLASVKSCFVRASVFEKLKAKGYSFLSIIDPSATVCSPVTISEGVVIMPGCVVQTGARLDPNCLVNTGAIIEHEVHLGFSTHVASRAVLLGNARIGSQVHIGAGSVVLQNLRIGDGAMVAAGAVVTKDVEAGVAVMGIPAIARP